MTTAQRGKETPAPTVGQAENGLDGDFLLLERLQGSAHPPDRGCRRILLSNRGRTLEKSRNLA
jgi:hypothetical protein